MSHKERQGALAHEIEKVIDYFRNEYDLTYADAVGVLSIMVAELCAECHQRMKEESKGDDEGNDSE